MRVSSALTVRLGIGEIEIDRLRGREQSGHRLHTGFTYFVPGFDVGEALTHTEMDELFRDRYGHI